MTDLLLRLAPIWRGLQGRNDQPVPIVRIAPSGSAEAAIDLAPDATDQVLQSRLEEALARTGSAPTTLAITSGGIALGTLTQRQPNGSGRMAGQVAVVTGAAQGFGLEIAQNLVAVGATVVLADTNLAGAQAAAAALVQQHGSDRALALQVDVTNDGSVAALLADVVRAIGGLDLFVANAGIVRAGSVKAQDPKDFDLVTAVNYRGFFSCAQHASRVMTRQNAASGRWSDIVQINSKSGLVGSNRNGAYAGSKFGGIGLVQSFALELVEDRIKVNAICPGNFFDGPLWSDPEKGLFVQYLRSNKVPGATTVADVKRFYEAKVPMNRGCRTADVMRALLYLVEQEYETGQALPVTGGQVMLG